MPGILLLASSSKFSSTGNVGTACEGLLPLLSSLPPKFLSEAGRLTKEFPYYQQLQLQQESSPERRSKRAVSTPERAGDTTENYTSL